MPWFLVSFFWVMGTGIQGTRDQVSKKPPENLHTERVSQRSMHKPQNITKNTTKTSHKTSQHHHKNITKKGLNTFLKWPSSRHDQPSFVSRLFEANCGCCGEALWARTTDSGGVLGATEWVSWFKELEWDFSKAYWLVSWELLQCFHVKKKTWKRLHS